jgi:hypothetical protein
MRENESPEIETNAEFPDGCENCFIYMDCPEVG